MIKVSALNNLTIFSCYTVFTCILVLQILWQKYILLSLYALGYIKFFFLILERYSNMWKRIVKVNDFTAKN